MPDICIICYLYLVISLIFQLESKSIVPIVVKIFELSHCWYDAWHLLLALVSNGVEREHIRNKERCKISSENTWMRKWRFLLAWCSSFRIYVDLLDYYYGCFVWTLKWIHFSVKIMSNVGPIDFIYFISMLIFTE